MSRNTYMKYCPHCKITKSTEEFSANNSRKDGLQNICKPCRKAYLKKDYDKKKVFYIKRSKINRKKRSSVIREFVDAYKSKTPCKDCNNNFFPFQMDFDHLGNKKFNISSAVGDALPLEEVKKEIEKCELVCANCHRLRTHLRRKDISPEE